MNNLDTSTLKMMLASASANLRNNRKLIDDLNVFPVPDGDTGTNMSLTLSGAVEMTLPAECEHAGQLFSKLASAALRNARGNSGVILSQIIRGFAKGLEKCSSVGIVDIKNALVSAKVTAYRAVMKPTEGTILTVIREAAEYAEASFDEFTDITEFLRSILDAAEQSLNRTTELLPALKKAGVVDAGGKGLVTIFQGMLSALESGKEIEAIDTLGSVPTSARTVDTDADIKFLYCTEFIINKTSNRKANQFQAAISDKGDCMLVIEDDDIVKVHIHTNHPGFVIEQALKLGELTNLKIDNMKYQHTEKLSVSNPESETDTDSSKPQKRYGFAAVSAGDGLSELFSSLNVDEIIEGGQTMNPSTQDLLSAVEKISAEVIYILPNNKNIILAAEQVNELTEKDVIVIPTVNIPQGFAAMMAFDDNLSPDENTEAMTELCAAVSCGQVTFAARDTSLDGMEIKLGDCLAVSEKEIVAVTQTPEEAVESLVEKMVTEDAGVITLYYGEDTSKESAEGITATLEAKYPDLDISTVYGGQPVYFYIISVE